MCTNKTAVFSKSNLVSRLKTEVSHMMTMYFWKNSIYWSGHLNETKKDRPNVVVKVAYFKNLNWFGFNFCKYHPDAVEILRSLPPDERFFYKITVNRYTSFKVWCIDSKHFDFIVAQLQPIIDIQLEFVVSHTDAELMIPEPFMCLGLRFRKRGMRC